MPTNYETYTGSHAPAVKAPAVTLLQRGQLSLNEAAFAALGSPEAVELMYSRDERKIAMRSVDPSVPHAKVPRTATKNKGRGPYVIAGAGFINYFDIKIPQTTRYLAAVEDGLLVVDLKEPGIPIVRAEPTEAPIA